MDFSDLDDEDVKKLENPEFKKAWVKYKAYWVLRDSGENLPYPPPPDPRFSLAFQDERKDPMDLIPIDMFLWGFAAGMAFLILLAVVLR